MSVEIRQVADTGKRRRDTSRPKCAVILSGGGANGAYEVGVLKALASGNTAMTDYGPFDPEIFVGTSVGAFNAAFLASQWDSYGTAAVANLESFWLDEIAGSWSDNGIFRFRANPFAALRPYSFFENPVRQAINFFEDTRYLFYDALERGIDFVSARGESIEQRLVELLDLTSFISTEPLLETLEKIDYQAIRSSPRWLKVAATNWTTGELRIFWNHDMSDGFGPVALRASAAIPGIFPPVECGTQLYSDGSVLLNTPLSPAIHAGADRLHLVYLDPSIDRIPLPRVGNTFETLFRTQQIQWAAAYDDDISDAARINQALGAIEEFEHEKGIDLSQALNIAAEGFGEVRRRYRPLTIFRYQPEQAFQGGLSLLNFDRDRLAGLIELGFQDTLYHDFREAGDVFPPGVEPPPTQRQLLRDGLSTLSPPRRAKHSPSSAPIPEEDERFAGRKPLDDRDSP